MYLLLASNCNKKIYGDVNQANHFYVNLPSEISLKKSSVIALREMFYSGYIPTIINEEFEIRFRSLVDLDEFYKPYEEGYYDNIKDVPNFSVDKDGAAIFEVRVPLQFSVERMKVHSALWINIKGFEYIEGHYHEDSRDISFYLKVDKVDTKAFIELEINLRVEGDPIKVKVPPKEYKSSQSLVDTINDIMTPYKTVFSYKNDVLTVDKCPYSTLVYMKNGLHDLLGFRHDNIDEGSMAIRKIEINRGIFTFFVYINIVESTMVGDVMVPLLKVVNYEKHDKPNVHMVFDNPQYIPLNRKSLRDIEVQICSDTGELIPFIDGKTSLLVEIINNT